MKRNAARYSILSQMFSADKHWVFILLIASNFVLFSLIFVVLNQDIDSRNTYVRTNIAKDLSLNSQKTNSTQKTFYEVLPEIKKNINLSILAKHSLEKDQNNINSFVSKDIEFFDTKYNNTQKYIFNTISQEYVPGSKAPRLGKNTKTFVEYDKWVKWLSSLTNGIQSTKIYSNTEIATVSSDILARKIGNNIYYIRDYYLNPSLGWIREYSSYDQNNKQINIFTINTPDKVILGTRVPNYSEATLKVIGQIEDLITKAGN